MNVAQAAGIPVVDPVDFEGNFTAEVPPYQGKNVFEANKDIIRDLKAAGVVVRHETYEHNYPHCWRTDQPLIYKAIPSWYVKVTAFRDRMVELNQGITWVPGACQRRHLRQLARQRARLEHRPQPLLGRADPGVEVGQSGLSRGSTSTARSTRSSAISACGRRTCTAPMSTSWSGPTRTIRPASR